MQAGAGAPSASGGSALNDLVDLNFGGGAPAQVPPNYDLSCLNPYHYQGPSPPQRTAASLDPWSPAGQGGDLGNGGGNDPWGGNIVSQSTIPDPWGGIGAHGVPPSRASPLAFHQGSQTQNRNGTYYKRNSLLQITINGCLIFMGKTEPMALLLVAMLIINLLTKSGL